MRMDRYLQWLLPTLCVMRHGLGVSLDLLADEIVSNLSAAHIAKLLSFKKGGKY